MMKKEYVKPEAVVENVMVETLISTSTGSGGQMPFDPNKPEGGRGANEHRGGWGDLWN